MACKAVKSIIWNFAIALFNFKCAFQTLSTSQWCNFRPVFGFVFLNKIFKILPMVCLLNWATSFCGKESHNLRSPPSVLANFFLILLLLKIKLSMQMNCIFPCEKPTFPNSYFTSVYIVQACKPARADVTYRFTYIRKIFVTDSTIDKACSKCRATAVPNSN